MDSYFSDQANHPANLICELCRLFYDNNWLSGTGGGISIRDVDGENPDIVYIAPSGIQKERLHPKEMFVCELPETIIRSPNADNDKQQISQDLAANFKYKPSACTPLFLAIYNLRDAGACIHTHSQNAVLATMIWEDKVEFRMNHQEQIKALPKLQFDDITGKVVKVGSLQNYDTMVIPIVENTPLEDDLTEILREKLIKYPGATAILVRRHGIHVWGENIWKAKVYNEAIDHLLELAIKMQQNGIPLVK